MNLMERKQKINVNFGYTEIRICFTNKKVYIQELHFDRSACMAAICYNILKKKKKIVIYFHLYFWVMTPELEKSCQEKVFLISCLD